MATHYYRALLVQDSDDGPDAGYGVVFPDFPGCVSAGDTPMDAAQRAAEALAGHVALMLDDKLELPAPSGIGAALPDWLDGSGRVAGEVLVPVELPGRAVRANITVDEALLHKIDRAAQAAGSTRSGFLAEAARAWLRDDQRKWVEERERDLRQQLDMLRSGKLRSYDVLASGQVDTTAASIARIEGWLAELPAVLKARL